MSKYDNIFNQDFFPTPVYVLDLMELDVQNKKILEPSAGKGDIIDYCSLYGAKKVYWCEINKDLAKICKDKGEQIGTDFLQLKAEDISHIDSIIMNPPFSEFKKHFLHAWEIAPDGCEIVSLCNNDTLQNLHYDSELKKIIEFYGYSNNLGSVFADAERMTDVKIGLIKVYKPLRAESINFDDYFDMVDDENFAQGNGIIKYSEIDSLISYYKTILKNIDSVFETVKDFKKLNSDVGIDVGFSFNLYYNDKINSVEGYKKQLQKIMWNKVFSMFKIEKYLTSRVVKDINSWLQNKCYTPFTKKNIFKMVEVIIGTSENSFNLAVVEAIDEFTKHTHENRYGVEGWKTNSGYLLNKKFIVDWFFEVSYSGQQIKRRYNGNTDKLNDLVKVLCNLTGKNYDTIIPITDKYNYECLPNVWYDSEFFEWKGFKKGTMHLKFKDVKVWELLNRKYANIKGNILPEKI
jgi:hypothetical protein